jgi:hypothetical protein
VDLVDHFSKELCLEASDRITMSCLDLVSAEGADQPIASHADVTMDAPDWKGQSLSTKCPKPGDSVVIVRIDQGPVNVEDRRRGHLRAPVAERVMAYQRRLPATAL